ncbi:hypothetical protein [Bartonella heixiaziensis]|uniref:hypothetical protein n=1 Tax=Bartonella heixiaziensis TaxID=1461000 RepID=UPI003D2511C2
MEIDDDLGFWRLSENFTLVNAALLIAGINPAKCRFINRNNLLESDIYDDHGNKLLSAKFRAAYSSILQAVNTESLRVYKWDSFSDSQTTVNEEDLKEWLCSRGMRPKFFFPEDDSHEMKGQRYAFQDPTHPRYAPKLAAVVAAWEAVTEVAPGEIVKQTLKKWLQDNASQYNLFNKKTGKRSDDVIEQLASVANWEPTGGAPKTIAKVSLEQKKDAKKSENSVYFPPLVDSKMPF